MKFLLSGDRLMPEMHLRPPWFTYSACGLFNKQKTKEFKHSKKQKIEDISTEMN